MMLRNILTFIFFCGCVKSEFIIPNKNYKLDNIKTFGGSDDDEANDRKEDATRMAIDFIFHRTMLP